MTDNEIIKALECCNRAYIECDGSFCNECPCKSEEKCSGFLLNNALNLINRQKAEIERLNGAVQEWVDGKCLSQKHLLTIGKLQNEIETAKSEAIKEFAERLKEKYSQADILCPRRIVSLTERELDNFAKEWKEGLK